MGANLGSRLSLKNRLLLVCSCLCFAQSAAALYAKSAPEICPRPAPGSIVTEPLDLHSRDGVLKVELTIHNAKQSDGSVPYCYIDENGAESPTLRVNPGDLVVLTLRNDLTAFDRAVATTATPHTTVD